MPLYSLPPQKTFIVFSILSLLLLGLLNIGSLGVVATTNSNGNAKASNLLTELSDFEVLGSVFDFDSRVRTTIAVDPYPIVYYPYQIKILSPYYASVRSHGIKYMTYGTFMAFETNYEEFVRHYNVTPGNFEDKITGVNLEGEYYRYMEPDVNGWPTMGFTSRSFWREIILNVTKLAIDAGADMIVYDGGWGSYPGALTGQSGNPERYVFDNESIIGFRQYLASKYSSEELAEKFGITDISSFNFTQYLIDKGYTTSNLDSVIYENLPSGLSPPDNQTMYLWREFENYHLKVLIDFYDRLSLELKSYAQDKGRNFWIAANLKPTLSYNYAEGRLSILPVMMHIDFPFFEIWYDDIEYPKRNVAPLLRTMYATGKHFASMTSPTPSFSNYFQSDNPYPEEQVLATAELIACGGWPQTQLHNLTYIRFIQQHPELLPKEEHGKIALIYSLPSAQNYRARQAFLNYYNSLYWSYLPYEAMFYLLSDMNNVSFTILIFGDNEFYPYTPTLEELSRYEALILPNVTCLSDSQVNLLLQYVEQGGILIGIGPIGIYDENGFPVSRPYFTSYFNASGWPGSDGSILIYDYGNGKIVSITDQLLTEYMKGRYDLYSDYEFPPEERESLLAEDYYMKIGWLIYLFSNVLNSVGIQPDISTDLNPFVMIVQYWDSSTNTMLFHFINYEYGLYEDKAIDQVNANFTFTLRSELQGKSLKISFYTPENPDGEILNYTIEPDGRIKVTIPRIHIWGILKVEEEKAEVPVYIIDTPTIWSGNILLDGDLIVNSNLTIIDSIVEIRAISNNTVRIEVLGGASLKIVNSTIRPYNESNHYYIRVYKGAKFYVENSTIESAGIWGPLDVGGVWVETWDTIVLRSKFIDCYQYGLFLMEANYTFIEDSVFVNCAEGVMLYQVYFAKIINSTFTNNTVGLYAKHTHYLDISKCMFENNSIFGAIVDRSEFTLVKDSYFVGSEWDGLSFWTSIFVEVLNCTSHNNGYGYTFRNTPVSTVLNSDSYDNVYSGILLRDVNSWSLMPPPVFLGYRDLPESAAYFARGDYLPSNVIGGWDGSETVISHSRILRNGEGISISCSGYFNEDIRIVNNTIENNGIGLRINDTSSSIVVGNNFINNIIQVKASNINVDFNATDYGNYWSDYSGSGPYQVYDNIFDYHPLTVPNVVADVPDSTPPKIEIIEEKWVDGWDADGVNDTLELIIQLQDETSFYTDPQDKIGWVNLVKPRPIEDGTTWEWLGIINQTQAYDIFPPEEYTQPNNITVAFGSGDYFHDLSPEEIPYVECDVYASDVYGNWARNDTAPPHITVVKYGSGSLKVEAAVFDSSSIGNVVLHYSTDGINYQSIPMTYDPEDETYKCIVQGLSTGKVWFYISATDIYDNYAETRVFTCILDKTPPFILNVHVTPSIGSPGTVFAINVTVIDASGVQTIKAHIQSPDEVDVVVIELFDDGAHGDGIAGDNIYGNAWDSSGASVGTYYIDIEAVDTVGNINVSENTVMFKLAYGVETATGAGTAYFELDNGVIEELISVDESTLPSEGKPDLEFPYGFFSFEITGLSPGQTVTVTITLPSDTPVGTQYWKYHTPEGWYQIPIGDDDGDNVITIQLTDGGLGDDDGEANGIIVDVGGPGIPRAGALVGGTLLASTTGVETISYFMVIIATLAVAILTYIVLKRRSL